MIRLAATASIAALVFAACTPAPADTPTAEDAAVAAASAEPVAPEDFQLSYILESENYTVQSEIDPAILAFDPPLAWRLWTQAKAQLDDVGQSADEGRRMADEGRRMADEDTAATGEAAWFRGYSLEITHKVTGVFGDVISVSDFVGTDTGGAHPNYFLAGAIHRKGETEPMPLNTFITDEVAFNGLVIKALVEEKLARGFTDDRAVIEAGLRELLVPPTDVPEAYQGSFVFEPSTEPGKVGGITVMFSPYDIGSYAEGSYEVTLPASELTPILTETWLPRFGGEPVIGQEPVSKEQ